MNSHVEQTNKTRNSFLRKILKNQCETFHTAPISDILLLTVFYVSNKMLTGFVFTFQSFLRFNRFYVSIVLRLNCFYVSIVFTFQIRF